VSRFANEVSPVAAAHADADTVAVTVADEQVMTGSAVEPVQAADDQAVADTMADSDSVMDERLVDDGKETVDASATRNQRQLLLSATTTKGKR